MGVPGPVVAIVLVLCAVFLPVAFGRHDGVMYKQFAITIAVSGHLRSGGAHPVAGPVRHPAEEGHHQPVPISSSGSTMPVDAPDPPLRAGGLQLNRRVGVAFGIIAVILGSASMSVPERCRAPWCRTRIGYLIDPSCCPMPPPMSRTQVVARF